jgi:pyrroline-5-carboxylate reductase
MPSGPETIRNKNGIAAVYPENQTLEYLLARLGLKVYTLPDEELMHVFTAGVCLPAALCEGKARRMNIDGEMQRICRKYPLLSEIYPWAQKVLPAFGSDSEREAYAGMMNTKGGVTEAIIASIRSGRTFSQAVEAGIERSKAISEQCSP